MWTYILRIICKPLIVVHKVRLDYFETAAHQAVEEILPNAIYCNMPFSYSPQT